jgi:hypothetical protein
MHGGQAWQPLLNRETTILRSAALPTFSGISPHFRPRRHLMNTPEYRAEMTIRFAIWDEATGVAGLPAEA